MARALSIAALVLMATFLSLGLGGHQSQVQASAPRVDIAIAQTAAGSGDGSSCANARAASFFNARSNWAPRGSIQPGKTIGLCGTITSTLTAQGSGTPRSPVTILFTPGSKISQPACDPCLDLDGRSYLTIDGGSSGIIESTDNGTHLGLHSNSTGIHATPCNNCKIKDLTIRNIYVHDGSGDFAEIDQTQVRSIYANGSNLTISHNTLHDAGWAVFIDMNNGDHDIHVDHNNIYNVDHGLITSSGTAGGSFGPIWFNDNHVHDFANWDTAGNAYHHDGIHCYTVAGGSPMHINDYYIYNNRFDGSIGDNATSWIFMEDSSGPSATPCADATSNIWLFNNVGKLDHALSNGVFAMFSGRTFAYNNTMIGQSTAPGNVALGTGGAFVGPGALKNNVFTTANQWLGASRHAFSGSQVDNNIYANGNPNGNGWFCDGYLGQLSRWQACIGGDPHARVIGNAHLGPDGVPEARSPVLGAGTNLATLCKGNLEPLCRDIRGALRPLRMAPDAGAFQRETAAITEKAIGGVRIGERQTSVERFYGRRTAVASKRPIFGVFRISAVPSATYRLHGGSLKVSYSDARVVAASTTSAYYTTPAGLGVGARVDGAKLAKAGWSACGPSLARRRHGTTIAVRVVRGLVRALAVFRTGDLRCRA